jgi:chloramphenicol 3-O phosphotransferase
MLIVLFGTSSSGKTSLARALQAIWPRPLLHIEADRFAPTLGPQGAVDDGLRARIVIAMHEAIAAFGRSGVDTIVDGSLPGEPELRDRCLAILRGVPRTKVVAVRCSVEVLRQREAARGDRVPGWAEEQHATIYEGVEFDLGVDTTEGSAAAWAQTLLRALKPNATSVGEP